MIRETARQHGVTEECYPVHCRIHGVDEPESAAGGFHRCFECGHLYPSKRALRRDHRRGYDEPRGLIGGGDFAFSEPHDPNEPRIRHWWRRWRDSRVSKIYFCAHCTHNF